MKPTQASDYTQVRNRIRKKQFQEQDVLTAAYERMRYIFRNFDKVVVSFSGGKDSTAVLNIAADVARELGKTPLEVVFFDEEVIPFPTKDYMCDYNTNKNIDFFLPDTLFNGISCKFV